jgi:hypothetical protein
MRVTKDFLVIPSHEILMNALRLKTSGLSPRGGARGAVFSESEVAGRSILHEDGNKTWPGEIERRLYSNRDGFEESSSALAHRAPLECHDSIQSGTSVRRHCKLDAITQEIRSECDLSM